MEAVVAILARLWRRLIPPECALCGRSSSGRMNGTYWHRDGCPAAVFSRKPGSDEE